MSAGPAWFPLTWGCGTLATVRDPVEPEVEPLPAATPVGLQRRSDDFVAFYARWARDAQRYAWTIAGPGYAEDACQDAWERIWRHWDRPDPQRREAWALRIVRNCCIDRLRSGSRVVLLADPDQGVAGDAETEALARIEVDDSLALLGRLTPALRETLWLREVGELSYAEIAQLQGVPVGTVMSRLHSARRKASRILRR